MAEENAPSRNNSPPIPEVPLTRRSPINETVVNSHLNQNFTPIRFLSDPRPPRSETTPILSNNPAHFPSSSRILTRVARRQLEIPLENLS